MYSKQKLPFAKIEFPKERKRKLMDTLHKYILLITNKDSFIRWYILKYPMVVYDSVSILFLRIWEILRSSVNRIPAFVNGVNVIVC